MKEFLAALMILGLEFQYIELCDTNCDEILQIWSPELLSKISGFYSVILSLIKQYLGKFVNTSVRTNLIADFLKISCSQHASPTTLLPRS